MTMNKIFKYTKNVFLFAAIGPTTCLKSSFSGQTQFEKKSSYETLGITVALVASAVFTAFAASKVTMGGSLAILGAVAIFSGPTTLFAAGLLTTKWGVTTIIHAVALKNIAIGLGGVIVGALFWALNPIFLDDIFKKNPIYRGGILAKPIRKALQ